MIPGIELLATVCIHCPWIFLYRSLFVAHRSFFVDYSRLYRAFERLKLITCDIYKKKKTKKEIAYNKNRGKNGMRYIEFFNLCYFFIRNIFIRCVTISYCHLYMYFYDHWIIPFFLSLLFFIRLISNQLNYLFFF